MSPDFSIVVDRTRIASLTGDRFERTTLSRTNLKNPPLTGHVRLRNINFETLADGRIASCCSRIFVRANGNYFDGRTSNSSPVSLIQSSASPVGSDTIFEYRTLDFSLPSDGSFAELRLIVDGETKVIGSISLAEDVITLPVNVHVFKRPGVPVHPTVSENRVRSWFASPPITMELQSTSGSVSGFRTTTITSEWIPVYTPVDNIWKQAGIQFSLQSYEEIEQSQGLERTLINSEEANKVCDTGANIRVRQYHNDRKDQPGVHIYIGGSISNTLETLGTIRPGGVCGASRLCSDSISDNDFMILDRGFATRLPLTLAHELGHILGLQHSTSRFSCGSLLVEESLRTVNLMSPTPTETNLTEKQIERARIVACKAMNRWGLRTGACLT